MAKISISVDQDGDLLIENNYSGVGFRSDDGEEFSICNRDTGFEFKYNDVWYEAKNGELKKPGTVVQQPLSAEPTDIETSDNGTINKTWNKSNPPESGSYICRMKNAYIKMCFWSGSQWFDMWKNTLEGVVVEWIQVPHNEM